jgi:release factor glutamine methyltransferase
LGFEHPNTDVELLLCHVLDCNATFIKTWPERLLSKEQLTGFYTLLSQRAEGQPVAYLIGQRGFWSLDLKVTAATLIPRPDTELLVELALSKLQTDMTVADLGTGSGAIALSLAHENKTISVYATDYCHDALQVAKENAKSHQLSNVYFWQGSWLEAVVPKCFDLIISNPPYIEDSDPHLVQGDLRFEPLTALASGTDGLDDIRIIVKQAKHCLRSNGWLMIEHGYQQAKRIQALFMEHGFINVSSHQDFGGNDRVVSGQLAL